MQSATQRIAKNTLMLYFRQILIMLVSLYTVRVVLNTLGAEDFGIYNVVAGVVTMFGFLSGSMAGASQRYFSFELGRRDFEQLKKTFSLSFLIYVLIAALILVLAETIGLWFLNNKLVIPSERMAAAWWVYQFAVLSFLFTILTTPYMAMIIAHEDMNIYAYVSIVEAALKLGIVFLLQIILADKLRLYGILLCVVALINTTIYRTICKIKYRECKVKFYWNKLLFKEMTSFIGWDSFSKIAGIARNQGVGILLNFFCGIILNATQGISNQVAGAVRAFSHNFMIAVRPQITKEYGAKNHKSMINLAFKSAKLSYFLMLVFSIPLLFEMPYILKLWLKNPPLYAVVFVRLTLINAFFEFITYPFTFIAQATGKIKLYNAVGSSIVFLNIPLSIIALKIQMPPYTVMIISIILSAVLSLFAIILVKRLVPFSIMHFIEHVIFPVFIVSMFSIIVPMFIIKMFEESFFRLCSFVVINTCVLLLLIYIIGLTKKERHTLQNFVWKKIKRIAVH